MNRTTSFIIFCALVVSCTVGHKHHKHDDDDEIPTVFWVNVGGIVVICVLCVVGAGLVSLCAWILCACHSKCRKDRVRNSPGCQMLAGPHSTVAPEWTRRLEVKPELGLNFGFAEMSDGMYKLSSFHLVRQRAGTAVTDGAKWAVPMTSGRHVFEFIWPWGCRGYHATVGVGTEDAPIKGKGGINLVGGNCKSWGLDIVRRQAIHNNKFVAKCPSDGSYVPDRFLMYVDLEAGTIGFGCDVTFWGNVITDLPVKRDKPLYVMVGSDKWQAQLQVYYKASEGDACSNSYNGNVFMVTPKSHSHVPGPHPLMLPAYSDVSNYPSSSSSSNNNSNIFITSNSNNFQVDWKPEPPPSPTAPSTTGDYEPPPPYASPPPSY